VEQRLSLITLGVTDMPRARAFYEALGWRGTTPDNDVFFYQLNGFIFALWDRGKLAADTVVTDQGGWGGITLAHNVRTRQEVDSVLAEAQAAGGTILRHGAETFWGGYSGVFADPEGHPWEVAHGAFTITDDGDTVLAG
jgi:catechol 2,3-dioxygenase-like lactoylglutathione lyase family enzyme